jgi:hypothetical protein
MHLLNTVTHMIFINFVILLLVLILIKNVGILLNPVLVLRRA